MFLILPAIILAVLAMGIISDESGATTADTSATAITSSANGIVYTLSESDDTAIAAWDGSSAEVTIKATVQKSEKTYSVTSIEAFSENTLVTKITIEPNNNLTMVSEQFSKCTALNTIVLGNGIKSIPSQFCKGTPVSSVSLPSTLESIGSEAFDACTSLTSITFPSSLTTIENNAFAASGLTSVVIPDTITSIGYGAFNCTSLENLTVTTSASTISSLSSVFGSLNKSIKSIDYTSDAIPSKAFSFAKNVTSVKIKAGTIGASAFNGCTQLTTVEISEGLETLPNSIFSGCTSLTTVTLPESITTWGTGIFLGCSALKSIALPPSLKTIPKDMFKNCNSLESIDLTGKTSIGNTAFYNCKALKSVQIPSSVTAIGNSAFYNCTSLESITLGENVETIGYGVFGNTKLIEITIPAKVTKIDFSNKVMTLPETIVTVNIDAGNTTYSVTDNIIYCNGKIVFCPPTIKGELVINADVDSYAFRNTSLSKVVFTDNVKTIGGNAFNGAKSLKEIILSDSIEKIDYSSLKCKSVTSLILPSNAELGNNALPSSLKYVSFGSNMTGIAFNSITNLSGKSFELYDANGVLIEDSNLNSIKGKRFVWNGVAGIPTKLYEMTDNQVLITTYINGDSNYCAADKNKVYAPTDPTVPEHYVSFAGWYCDSAYTQEYNKTASITADTVIYAKFNPETHTVKYLVDGETFGDINTYDYGSEVTLLSKYVKTGYTVTDWVYPEGLEVSDDGKFTIGSADLVFTATTKINQYTITFDTVGGFAINSITQDYNSSVTAPSATKDGYTFIQWTLNGEAYTIDTMPAENITLKAVWIKNYAADSESGAVIIDAVDSDGFIPSAGTKVVTVNIAKNTSIKIENAEDLAGKTVASRITKISNASDKAGTAYEFIFTADSVQYNGKILVTLPYTSENGKQPAIYYWNGTESQKMNVISSTDTSVTFETDHNSQYIVTMEDAPELSNNMLLIAIAAIIVILAIIGVLYYRKTQQQQ